MGYFDSECQEEGCEGPAMDNGLCYHCGGQNYDEDHGAPENNDNAVSHGLHTSAETFFANAAEHHLDTYYAMHESLCDQYETLHGHLPESISKDLAEIAFEMAKLDMAKEYEAENAADSEKPITETQMRDIGGQPMQVEAVSKVESLKTDIRRENRLALKDMGIYRSPEQQQAEATKELGELARAALED